MSTNVMRSLRFTEFGPPSVLRIQEVAIPEPGVGEALVQVKAAAINPSDIGDVAGRFKSTTLPRTPGRDFAGIVVKGKRPEGAEVWGSCPDPRYRPGWISRRICRCPGGNAVAQTEVVEYGSSRRDRDSLYYGLGIGSECSSNPARRNNSNRWRRGRGGTSSHTDCELEAGPRYRRGYEFRSPSWR